MKVSSEMPMFLMRLLKKFRKETRSIIKKGPHLRKGIITKSTCSTLSLHQPVWSWNQRSLQIMFNHLGKLFTRSLISIQGLLTTAPRLSTRNKYVALAGKRLMITRRIVQIGSGFSKLRKMTNSSLKVLFSA
jgi:hypothetical protein